MNVILLLSVGNGNIIKKYITDQMAPSLLKCSICGVSLNLMFAYTCNDSDDSSVHAWCMAHGKTANHVREDNICGK